MHDMNTDVLDNIFKSKTFKEIAQDFLDEINHQLEEGNIDLGIKTSVEDVYEMLDSIVEYL